MDSKKFIISICALIIFTFFFSINGRDCLGGSYSPNVHWVFCVDTSGSMKKKGHLDLLKLITDKITNEFLNTRKNIIRAGDRISIFSFDDGARLEATALYQTESDILAIRDKLKQMNKRSGNLTFISDAIVKASDFTRQYSNFFHTNALYVFTDGKSDPYSKKWPAKKRELRKKKDMENFQKISQLGRFDELNVWLGVLRWEAFNDAKSLVTKMGKGGHLVDLTDFNRLSLEKALANFAETVRATVKFPYTKAIDLGTIPYKQTNPYETNISLKMQTQKMDQPPLIAGRISFDPDNPSEIKQDTPVEIKTAEDKMVLNFEIPETGKMKPGKYRAKLNVFPDHIQFGALVIEPSQFDVTFTKSGYLSFYVWRVIAGFLISFSLIVYFANKVRKRMPIKV